MKYFDFVANRRACLWREVKTILPKPNSNSIARACFIFLLCTLMTSANKSLEKKISLTIGSYVGVRSSRYEARGKFGEHERCIRVARGVTESKSRFLSALQTSQVLHISTNAQLTHEPIGVQIPYGPEFFSGPIINYSFQ